MAANFRTQSSLVQPKPSLSAKTLQNPSASLIQGLVFCQISELGLLEKSSLASAVSDSTSSGLENKKNSKNPIIVIDNYDSFNYNLCQYMGELGCHFEVYQNDELAVEELKRNTPRFWNIIANSFGNWTYCTSVWCLYGFAVHRLGFGGNLVCSPYGVMHGKSSVVYYDEKEGDGLFTGLSNPINAGRYHSLMIEKDIFPGEALEVTAWTEDGLIMAARHKVYKYLQQKQKKMVVKQQRSLVSVSIKEMISALKDCEMYSFP